MLKLIGQRLAQMMLIMAVVSLVLFAVFDSDTFKKQLAVNELGGFAVEALSDSDYEAWLENKGLNVPFYSRYANWWLASFKAISADPSRKSRGQ
jgi:peptide/nickel transport system permease protein